MARWFMASMPIPKSWKPPLNLLVTRCVEEVFESDRTLAYLSGCSKELPNHGYRSDRLSDGELLL